MKGRMAALNTACARANPVLMPVAAIAFAIVLLDLVVAAQRWAAMHPER